MSESAVSHTINPVGTTRPVPAPELCYLPRLPAKYRPKIGLIGAGGISEYHLKAYQQMGLDVVAICDSIQSRAESRKAQFYPGATVYSDHRALLTHPKLEVVDVATHPKERAAIIETALHARKHVLSQKPFALDLDVAKRLCDLADSSGVKLAVNQNGRWAPHFSYLIQAVKTGIIGEITSVNMSVNWDHSYVVGTPFDKIHHLVLYDFSIHWFDIASVLLGQRKAKLVTAMVSRSHGQVISPPALAVAAIDYGDAQVRLAFNAQVRYGPEDRTIVTGVKGTLVSEGPSLSEQAVTIRTEAGEASPALKGTWFTNGFQGTMGELLCAIEERREPSNSGRDNLTTLSLCFAAMASADTLKPVEPGSVTQLTIS